MTISTLNSINYGIFIFALPDKKGMAKIKYNRIKTALTEAGKQSSELAEFMKVHETTVSDWCTNTNQPSVQVLFEISRFLRMNVRKLLVPTSWPNEPLKEARKDPKEKTTKRVSISSKKAKPARKQIKK